MPLPPPSADRLRVHQRTMTFEGFRRADDLWDIEGHLVDTKDQEFRIQDDIRLPGDAVHDISVRVTIDEGQLGVPGLTQRARHDRSSDECARCRRLFRCHTVSRYLRSHPAGLSENHRTQFVQGFRQSGQDGIRRSSRLYACFRIVDVNADGSVPSLCRAGEA